MNLRYRSMGLLMLATLALACSPKRVPQAPAPAQAYADVLSNADERVREGDYAGADRILSDFQLKAPGTEEATEITFWRALYMVDPANRRTSIPEGIRALDIYLATPGTRWYRGQAEVVRRTAQSVLALRNATQAQPRVIGRDTVFVTREEELAVLRDQLARANAELDRIKKRLANPSR